MLEKIFIYILFCLLMFPLTFGEQTYLKNGDAISGSILSDNPSEVDVQNGDNENLRSKRKKTLNYWGNNLYVVPTFYSNSSTSNSFYKMTGISVGILPFAYTDSNKPNPLCMMYTEKNYYERVVLKKQNWYWTWTIMYLPPAAMGGFLGFGFDSFIDEKMFWGIGTIYLFPEIHFGWNFDVQSLSEETNSLTGNLLDSSETPSLTEELLKEKKEYKRIPLANLLSLPPGGLGHLYAGDWGRSQPFVLTQLTGLALMNFFPPSKENPNTSGMGLTLIMLSKLWEYFDAGATAEKHNLQAKLINIEENRKVDTMQLPIYNYSSVMTDGIALNAVSSSNRDYKAVAHEGLPEKWINSKQGKNYFEQSKGSVSGDILAQESLVAGAAILGFMLGLGTMATVTDMKNTNISTIFVLDGAVGVLGGFLLVNSGQIDIPTNNMLAIQTESAAFQEGFKSSYEMTMKKRYNDAYSWGYVISSTMVFVIKLLSGIGKVSIGL